MFSELVWFLKTGGTRMARMMLGLEPFVADINILLEGYQHYTRSVRGGFCHRIFIVESSFVILFFLPNLLVDLYIALCSRC